MSQLAYTIDPAIAIEGLIASPLNETEIDGETFAVEDLDPGLYRVKADEGRLLEDAATGILATQITNAEGGFIAGEFAREALPADATNRLYVAEDPVPFMKKGTLWVIPEGTVNYGNPVHVRRVVTGGERLGAVRATADGTDTEILPNAQFVSNTTAPGQLAKIRFNCTGS